MPLAPRLQYRGTILWFAAALVLLPLQKRIDPSITATSAAASTATVTVNVTGQVLGVGGVTNSVNPGAYTNNGVTFTGNVFPMGNITATLGANGQIAASGTSLPNAGLTGWTATGTLTATALNLTFAVGVAGGGTATGTITLTK